MKKGLIIIIILFFQLNFQLIRIKFNKLLEFINIFVAYDIFLFTEISRAITPAKNNCTFGSKDYANQN